MFFSLKYMHSIPVNRYVFKCIAITIKPIINFDTWLARFSTFVLILISLKLKKQTPRKPSIKSKRGANNQSEGI